MQAIPQVIPNSCYKTLVEIAWPTLMVEVKKYLLTK